MVDRVYVRIILDVVISPTFITDNDITLPDSLSTAKTLWQRSHQATDLVCKKKKTTNGTPAIFKNLAHSLTLTLKIVKFVIFTGK